MIRWGIRPENPLGIRFSIFRQTIQIFIGIFRGFFVDFTSKIPYETSPMFLSRLPLEIPLGNCFGFVLNILPGNPIIQGNR